MMEIKVEPFTWNDNFSKVAQEDFSKIRNTLPYGVAQSIVLALAKLELLEKQGCKVEERQKMNNLEKAKEIIKEHYGDADCGIFDSRNIVGDMMETIYNGNGLTIDICYDYSYFEVFGLSDEEFEELEDYYYSLK